MSNEELFSLYFDLFNIEPIMLITVSQDDPRYIKMVNEAIINGKPIDDELVTKHFGNKYDVINNGFSNFKKGGEENGEQ